MNPKLRNQPRIKNLRRRQLPSCVLPLVRKEIEKIALKNHVSKSWVIHLILADFLNIKIERY